MTLSRADGEMLSGSSQSIEEQIKQRLLLSESTRFPVRRLCTLWRSSAWRPVITKLCTSAVGRDFFNISLFELMLSCRIDAVRTTAATPWPMLPRADLA